MTPPCWSAFTEWPTTQESLSRVLHSLTLKLIDLFIFSTARVALVFPANCGGTPDR